MAYQEPESADSRNKFEDLSGIDNSAFANPYEALLEACNNDPAQVQIRYATHRNTRNAQQKEKLLSPEFTGLILDPILQRLVDPSIQPGYVDPRNCIVFWARPPAHIRSLVGQVQQKLLSLAPNFNVTYSTGCSIPTLGSRSLLTAPELWLMPLPNCHLTALEITFSLTLPQVNSIVADLGNVVARQMTDYTYTHRARLIKPKLSYDGAALALSFLPAAGEALSTSSPDEISARTKKDDNFTYHHLRRDLFDIASKTGVKVDSRYVVPSSHITVGRFLTQEDHDTPGKMAKFIELVEAINDWLKKEFWPRDGERRMEGEWIVGQEKGLDYRIGPLWYGGGETVRIGKGF